MLPVITLIYSFDIKKYISKLNHQFKQLVEDFKFQLEMLKKDNTLTMGLPI